MIMNTQQIQEFRFLNNVRVRLPLSSSQAAKQSDVVLNFSKQKLSLSQIERLTPLAVVMFNGPFDPRLLFSARFRNLRAAVLHAKYAVNVDCFIRCIIRCRAFLCAVG